MKLSPEINANADINQASAILARWDAQQTGFIRHREMRFEVMCTMIKHVCEGKKPRVLDLACGPGSLSQRLLNTFPDIEIVAVDKDPLLLEIGTEVFAEDDRIRFQEVDLDTPNWLDTVEGPFDAVVSTTALHWLEPEFLARVYFELAKLIRPGGVFMNGDHLLYDALSQPTFRAVAEQEAETMKRDTFGNGVEDWKQWWDAVEALPKYAKAVARRKNVWSGRNLTPPKVTVGYHLETLRSAGFSQTGVAWQCFDDYVVAAIR